MRNRVERLRMWMVAGTALIVLMVAGFLGYARYRSRAFLAGLPGRLGAEITRETNGYTYSQTVEGKTILTLHAAKMEQRKDGVVHLHDVGVVVYGRKANRADRIYGDEFEYDQEKGVVKALGIVHMDLLAPAPAEGSGKKQRPVSVTGGELAGSDPATKDPRVIHVMTRGLVYLTKLGVAATGEDVEFSEGVLKGRAHGADYSSDTGLIVLQSAVRVDGPTPSGPMVLTASRAELNQAELMGVFANAKVVTAAETVEAARAVVHVRKDGSPEHMEGSGRVTISRPSGGVVTSQQAELALNAAGKAEDARLWGGVHYTGDEDGRAMQGSAAEARVRFDAAGFAEHVTATGDAMVQEREGRGGQKSTRTLTARVVEASLVASAKAGSREVREAVATDAARLVVENETGAGMAGAGRTRTEMQGDVLKAQVVGGRRVSNVVGTGHTVLHQVNAEGVDETSSGDRTDLVFRTTDGVGAAGRTSGNSDGLEDVVSAVQDGHVSMLRKVMRQQNGAMAATEEKGTAERAVYTGETNVVTLTGGVVLADPESTLWAAKVTVNRGTGDATADGGVRMSYLQEPPPGSTGGQEREPVHVLAARAELRGGSGVMQRTGEPGGRSAGLGTVQGTGRAAGGAGTAGGVGAAGTHHAFFYGAPGRMARIWQGTSQVEAPVIELEEGPRRLTAHGVGEGMQVHTVLVGTGQAASAKPGEKKESGPSVVRVLSRDMVYTDAAREVVFRGGVVVDDADGRMKAQTATAYLQAANGGAGRLTGELFSAGAVDRVVSVGRVEIDQPGRHGTGERLVYTASDGYFMLTGTEAAPPRVTDADRGTVTGEALRFHSGDDSVVVTGGGIQGASGIRHRTETKIKQ